ncbi:hypothetical protein [Acinetobacter courvalinii]|uniref:hypothetical protein n=1 Tax=Acinetobacter courvalinii TaxID=280147 RepID=UPI0002CD7317|nr:hypothetical protein [Acinetobacter courvalinii]ENX09020.1 hypothetical protein F898_00813 [Acinetobacter courvalinii]
MLHRPFKIMLVSVLSGMSFTACSTLQNQNPDTPQVLEQIKNIGASPTTENNIAKLVKQDHHCVIEFTGYFDGGKAVEHWTFNQSGLISASSSTQHTTLVSANTTTAFDIDDPAVQANFKKLQSNFSASTLAQCH